MKNILIPLLFTLFANLSMANSYAVLVPGFERPVTLQVPAGFSLPQTQADRERRERFLNYYRLNPNIKGKYHEVFLKDWANKSPNPQIVVSTLAATEKQQGKITKQTWDEARGNFLNASNEEIQKIRKQWRPAIEDGSPTGERIQQELLWVERQKDPSTVIVLAIVKSDSNGVLSDVISSRKLMYHEGYIVVANLTLDAGRLDAITEALTYLKEIRILKIK